MGEGRRSVSPRQFYDDHGSFGRQEMLQPQNTAGFDTYGEEEEDFWHVLVLFKEEGSRLSLIITKKMRVLDRMSEDGIPTQAVHNRMIVSKAILEGFIQTRAINTETSELFTPPRVRIPHTLLVGTVLRITMAMVSTRTESCHIIDRSHPHHLVESCPLSQFPPMVPVCMPCAVIIVANGRYVFLWMQASSAVTVK